MNVPFEKAVEIVAERPGQDAAYVIDSTRARTELGWTPRISLAEGMSETIDWVNAHWDEIKSQPLTYQHKP
jgi:dTDP-glucose 4,6-dehydratase